MLLSLTVVRYMHYTGALSALAYFAHMHVYYALLCVDIFLGQRKKEKIKDVGPHGIQKWDTRILEEADECRGWKRVIIHPLMPLKVTQTN